MSEQLVHIKVEGMEEVMRELRRFPDKLTRKTLLQIARPHANKIKAELKGKAPIGPDSHKDRAPGNLKKSINVRVGKGKNKKLQPYLVVGPQRGSKKKYDAWYAAFLEYGTKEMAAKPFIRPVYEGNKRFVSQDMAHKIKLAVRKNAAKRFHGSR